MSVTEELARLGGVATRAVIIRATSRREFERAVSDGQLVRDGHGRYALPVAGDALRAANALGGVVSHRSAALHHGWQLKLVPERPDVLVRRHRNITPSRCDGVDLHWGTWSPADVVGLATAPERTLLDCLRALPFDEALAIADSALRHRGVTKPRLIALAATVRGPGAPQARKVAEQATHLAANPFESVLRAISLAVPRLELMPQVVIRDLHGAGRPDLVDKSLGLVVEADSFTWHSQRAALRRDCRRYNRLVLLGWRVIRFAWDDVMFEPGYVRECLVEAVALVGRRAGSAADRSAAT